jgi:hypothetical protein
MLTTWASVIFSLSLLYIDIFFSTSHLVRVDAFILFFSTLTLFFTQCRMYLLASFAAAISIETHLIGAITFF